MSEDRFDVIIVGGGMAGCAAAITLASAGKEVILIERGNNCGSKNMTGGRLYGHSLEKLIPGFADRAPVERIVKKEKISMMTADGSLDIGYQSEKLGQQADQASYTVLRGKFDQWLAKEAEEAGAEIITGILVDRLITENGRVCGVEATGEEMYADIVILADGVNSLLAQQIGLKKELEPQQVAVGAKEVIRLGEETINQRFGLTGNEGMAWLSCGDPSDGNFGGGFIYTNKDTLSVGIVATLSDIGHSDLSVPEMLDRFKAHPAVAPYLEGGEVIEYSGHLVPEEGLHMMPELVADGVMIAGDAAGMCVNLGFTVRGMDFAIESGRLAGEAAIKALDSGDFSKAALSSYKDAVAQSFIMKDLKQSKGFPVLLTQRAVFEDLPVLADRIFGRLFTTDSDTEKKDIVSFALDQVKQKTSAKDIIELAAKVVEAYK